ncbi:hypothetical protein K491DRAFT_755221 [Lophiostoma macrostomum CBS 122681]|uniref:BZIP domain-containing protein n=1 Tax=Lophiostoma macrostomum CBS 122681 TaxID=1314788 RepID=A0A6A6TM81_9PLEO|nr:hypothetical protein K491DRAFT_755221 [Lophiostoma macrostomum CBS 122681]
MSSTSSTSSTSPLVKHGRPVKILTEEQKQAKRVRTLKQNAISARKYRAKKTHAQRFARSAQRDSRAYLPTEYHQAAISSSSSGNASQPYQFQGVAPASNTMVNPHPQVQTVMYPGQAPQVLQMSPQVQEAHTFWHTTQPQHYYVQNPVLPPAQHAPLPLPGTYDPNVVSTGSMYPGMQPQPAPMMPLPLPLPQHHQIAAPLSAPFPFQFQGAHQQLTSFEMSIPNLDVSAAVASHFGEQLGLGFDPNVNSEPPSNAQMGYSLDDTVVDPAVESVGNDSVVEQQQQEEEQQQQQQQEEPAELEAKAELELDPVTDQQMDAALAQNSFEGILGGVDLDGVDFGSEEWTRELLEEGPAVGADAVQQEEIVPVQHAAFDELEQNLVENGYYDWL